MIRARVLFFIKLLRRLFHGHYWQLLVLTVFGFLVGTLGGLSIGALLPLITFSLKGSQLGSDFISRNTASFFKFFGTTPSTTLLLVLVCGLFIVKAVMNFFFQYITTKWSVDYQDELRTRVYSATIRADWPYLSHHKIGHLEHMLSAHVKHVQGMWVSVANSILGFANFIMYFIVAFKLAPFVTAMTLAMGIPFFIFSRILVKRTRWHVKEQVRIEQEMAHTVNENVIGFKTIKAMGVEREISAPLNKLFLMYRRGLLKIQMLSNLNTSVIEPSSVIFIAILFSILSRRSGFDAGTILVTIYLIQRIFGMMETILKSMHRGAAMFQFVDRYFEFEEELAHHREETGGIRPFRFESVLEFRNVSLSYASREHISALKNVSFSVQKGEVLGVVGHSGAGKTTLVDILMRLLGPQEGGVVLDGIPASEINLGSWRRHIGYVTQDLFLKNDTVLHNIQFYDASISRAGAEEAAKKAYVYDFIMGLPRGFDTVIGERGVLLSGGERQRVVLARVFARRPEILILDEATSALDNASEVFIKNAIAALKGTVTIIVIAHRLSTIMSADRIVVLEQGLLIEEGRPEELLEREGSHFSKSYHAGMSS